MMNILKNKKVLIVFVISLVLIFIGVLLFMYFKNNEKVIEVSNLTEVVTLSSSDSSKAVELIKENTVKVINKIDDTTRIIGTGFFDKSGYLVTNSHIVDIKGDITIEYANGNKTTAKLYSNDIISDLALLAVSNPSVKALYYGETLSLKVTDDVYAIGYPYALDGEASVSKGVLSARRSAGGIEFLQSDISLNVGNSGGPLINDKGELLGINTYATDNASIGMAISSESLQIIINKLIKDKSINYLEDKRPDNALSVVLTEIGYNTEDLYSENKYIKKHDGIHDNGNESDKNKNDDSSNQNNVTKKSSDASLSNITVENYDIGFDYIRHSYYVTLRNQETSLNINVTPSNSKAKYIINNNGDFKEGNNLVTINVTAEDGTTDKYEINVAKPITYLEEIKGILCGLDTQKNNGVNSFHISCDYIDSDRIRVNSNIPLDIAASVKIDVYAGWNNGQTSGPDVNGKPIRFLKSFSFNPADSYYIALNDIRELLNDDDYEGGSYEGADLTFNTIVNTRKQGSLSGINPWGLSR